MPDFVACPHCERKLKVPPTLLGKRVKCPACQEPFTATLARPTPTGKKAAPPARPPRHDDDDEIGQRYDVITQESPEDEDEDGRRKPGLLEQHLNKQIEDDRQKRGQRPFADNWRKARLGLRFVSLAALILVTNFLVIGAGRLIIYLATQPDDLAASPTEHQIKVHKQQMAEAEKDRREKRNYLASATAIVSLVGQLVALIGIGICLLSPDKNAMRLLAGAALVLALACLGLEIGTSIPSLQYLASQTTDAQGSVPLPHPALKIFTDLTGYLRFFVFLFFMRAVAVTTKSDDLKWELLLLMCAFGAVIVYWVIMAALTAAKLSASLGSGAGAIVIENSVIGVMGGISLGLVLAGVVWFAMTVHTTSIAITDWLRERK